MLSIRRSFRAVCFCLRGLPIGAAVLLMAVPALAEDVNTGPTQINQPASACRTLSVGGADGWEPISYIRENGQHTGLAIDILRDYAKRHDLRVEVNLDIPWTRAMQMLGSGELDVIAGAYFTAERNQIHFYSKPFAQDDIMVFQRRNDQFQVNDLHDLIGYRGARPQGGSYGDYIDMFAEQRLDMIFSPTGNRIFDVLLNGRVDYVMLGRFDGLTNIYRDSLSDKITAIEPPIDSNDVHFLFSRKSPCMRHVQNLNVLIENMSENGTLGRWTESHLFDTSEGAS